LRELSPQGNQPLSLRALNNRDQIGKLSPDPFRFEVKIFFLLEKDDFISVELAKRQIPENNRHVEFVVEQFPAGPISLCDIFERIRNLEGFMSRPLFSYGPLPISLPLPKRPGYGM
jgi:hypothetical protein